MADDLPRARDVLGMPVPPSWASAASVRLRNGLARTQDRMAPPFNVLLEKLFGMIEAKAIHVAVILGIPDALHEGPLTPAELADRVDQPVEDADALERLLRFLASRGVFREERGRFANTALSDVLRRDHPWSWRAFALFLPSDWSFELWNALPDRVRTGRTASELAKGVPFFEYVNDVDPAAGQAFNGAMAAGSFLQALLFADAVDLAEVGSICDVGGGSGQLVAHLLRRHPHLRGAVLDLPALGTEAQRVFDGAGVADRAVFEGSDFFASVPAGYDVYTLFAVVHDWGDDDCVRILENVKQAMPGSGRVLVVEKPLPAKAVNDFSWFADMLMLVYADGGRERTNRQYEVLFARAGLRLVGRTRLPSLFEVFELRI